MKGNSCALLLLLIAANLGASEPQISCEVGFSPGRAQELILREIDGAKHEILVAAYSFSSKPIADALDAAHKRGVVVKVVCEHKGNDKKATIAYVLAARGVGVRLDGHYAIMHNKFRVFDGQTVQTGLFNLKRKMRR